MKAKIDGLLKSLAGFGQMPERCQCLLEAAYRLPVGRSHLCPAAGLLEVPNRLLPPLALDGMVREPLNVLGQTLGIELLDGVDDPGMEWASAIQEDAPVANVVCERVLDRVLELREEAHLIQELGRLEVAEALA